MKVNEERVTPDCINKRVGANKLIALVGQLVRERDVGDSGGIAITRSTPGAYVEYRIFLEAGGFVSRRVWGIQATEEIDALWKCITSLDTSGMLGYFRRVDSFDRFVRILKGRAHVSPEELHEEGFEKKAAFCYGVLAEVCGAALWRNWEGIWPTFSAPSVDEVAWQAIQTYDDLHQGEQLVLTGSWLDGMAEKFGVHPVRSRELLERARAEGLLYRYLEGASPFAGGKGCSMRLLTLVPETQHPRVRTVNLYDGTFLVPGIASVHMRLERQ